ncbi:hypothetical protein SAMN05216359_101534 [Roseateles sp. YR242]|uniref:hypothetical protein n=1 Tax=Roseateles sp. YR242 TaxID=1855305 RepID=UPI0008C011DB|nr:hypothetical protein [Roseateles sp. YR242]SEK35479.1 hypothetical protein SAMN05216359_101534 [Roseateles sp. YR242]
MKQTLRTSAAVAAILACGLAFGQTTANPNAKVDPKNNKVSKPVVDKPKQKLMTREELRSCLFEDKSLNDENGSLKVKEKEVLAERDALKAFKAEQDKAEAEMQTRSKDLKTEIESVKAFGAEIEAGAAKMEKDQLKAKQEEYTARANALQPRIDAFNKERNERVEKYKGFNDRVDAHAKAQDDFNEAVETLQDKRDDWKKRCANRPYDEADEIAIKKEIAAGKK